MLDIVNGFFLELVPYVIYVAVGSVIAELIIVVYAIRYASEEEKKKALEVSRQATKRLSEKHPVLSEIPDMYLSANVAGAYAIMPITTVMSFMAIWYIVIPGIWFFYNLAVDPELQRIWELAMRSIS